MAPFDQHPIHVRKKIAFFITAGIAIILIFLLMLVYTRKAPVEESGSGSRLKDFYTTIVRTGQSSETEK